MARFELRAGAEIDLLTKGELDDSLRAYGDQLMAGMVRGIRYRRLPSSVLTGQAVSGSLVIGTSELAGPDSGFCWSLRRIFVRGLTAGATPDVVNIYRNGTTSEPVWQISGASPQATFGRLEAVWQGGESFVIASVGTFAATGQIVVSGEVIEVPAEMLGKLA